MLFKVAKCEWVTWVTGSDTRVRNLSGSGHEDSEWYVNGQKKQAYEWITGEKFGECSSEYCSNVACDTAHVVVDGQTRIGLVPLCRSCNSPHRRFWFILKKGSLIVPLLRVLTPHRSRCVYNTDYDDPLQRPINPQICI
jgi:hypothetical protein